MVAQQRGQIATSRDLPKTPIQIYAMLSLPLSHTHIHTYAHTYTPLVILRDWNERRRSSFLGNSSDHIAYCVHLLLWSYNGTKCAVEKLADNIRQAAIVCILFSHTNQQHYNLNLAECFLFSGSGLASGKKWMFSQLLIISFLVSNAKFSGDLLLLKCQSDGTEN